ncbi:hypothetical protein MAIT1_00371 [Magnetofaba australis IT-1]|uniref:Divergent polysaccharide deacetylase family protein n=1 Tax=Magnetofaba australis IT-1 TaxID=1434232 RepID=A0A1Y2K7Q2_9PROT|nr:hypothetical protein MAIT1_00371 [Magnetofaba australis IT-1]
MKLALIIDDLGYNGPIGRAIAKLPGQLTLAILPGGNYSRQVVNLGVREGKEIMLHQPMEPQGYPRVNPGPGALLKGMPDKRIRRILAHNLDEFPEAIGVNNHMGSRLTTDRSAMNAVMGVILQRGLYFVDSRTSGKTVAFSAAANQGVPRAQRAVFIDNTRSKSAILNQLRQLERVGRSHGEAVGIGHPYPETLAALRSWLPMLARKNIQLVSASQLLTPHASRAKFADKRRRIAAKR